MNKPFLCPLLCACFLVCVLATPSRAQDPAAETTTNVQGAAAHIRALHFMRDYEGADLESKALLIHFPDAPALRAWRIVSMARYGRDAQALAEAEAMVAADSTNPWALFALAAALNWHDDRYEEGLDASEKALAAAPDHPDFAWLRAEILARRGHEEDAIALVDEVQDAVENPVELLATKAYALYVLSRGKDADPAKLDEALATFEAARALDPENVDAQYLTGWVLSASGRRAEAYAFLKTAAALTPNPRVHSAYWRAAMGLRDKSSEEKRADIEADIDALLAHRGASLYLLSAVNNQYETLKLADKKKALEERILEIDPYSEEAEWVLVGRYRAFSKEHGENMHENDSLKALYRGMLEAFINRPQYILERLLGDAYRSLFYVTRDDSTVSDEAFLEIVNGMVAYEEINPHITYAGSAIALAERKAYFREAEHLARQGVKEAKKKIDGQKERGAYETDGDYESSLNRMTGLMYDALGWVFFNEDRLDNAESELLRAYDLKHDNLQNLYHLGRLYEARYGIAKTATMRDAPAEPSAQLPEVENHLMKAESFYLKGITVQTPGENPNDKALQALYERQFGSLDGYETYLATAEERDRTRRKKEILEARFETPEPLEPFFLKTLDGDSLSTDDLRGKTVAINMWGLWCGPCVEEMPDLQKLHEQYRDSTDVLLLTINNDENIDEVRAWMQEKGYTFPVLLDDGYLNRVNSHIFPTTWFLDREVRKAFEKIGWSEKLVEEFSWRLEDLRVE